jgi:hypothetical protein
LDFQTELPSALVSAHTLQSTIMALVVTMLCPGTAGGTLNVIAETPQT